MFPFSKKTRQRGLDRRKGDRRAYDDEDPEDISDVDLHETKQFEAHDKFKQAKGRLEEILDELKGIT